MLVTPAEVHAAVPGRTPGIPASQALLRNRVDWERHRSPAYAADLLGAAVVLGQPNAARDAAEFLLRPDVSVPVLARELARQVLGHQGAAAEGQVDYPDRRRAIRDLRHRLRAGPRNPLLWVDLAREYVVLGQYGAAERAIRTGLGLAPHSRFVLRAASRFYVHTDRPDVANDLLRRAAPTERDPWLLAAEIATADVAGRTSRNMRTAQRILASGSYDPAHLSELACAVGTVELEHGERKKAKKLFFDRALDQPTENAVAQVSWAVDQVKGWALEPEYLLTPRSFEARAWQYYLDHRWEDTLMASDEWFLDEPFSARPAILASFVAAVAKEDYARSAELARRGLAANPNDAALLNNLAFALANLGNLPGASAQLAKLNWTELSTDTRIACLATTGLLYYRAGQPERGREFYQRAIDMAKGAQYREQRAAALLYQAREEVAMGSPDAEGLLASANEAWKGLDSTTLPTAKSLLRRLAGAYAARTADAASKPREDRGATG